MDWMKINFQETSYFYGELDSTHPFREGIVGLCRKFSADIALSAGYELDWEPTGHLRKHGMLFALLGILHSHKNDTIC